MNKLLILVVMLLTSLVTLATSNSTYTTTVPSTITIRPDPTYIPIVVRKCFNSDAWTNISPVGQYGKCVTINCYDYYTDGSYTFALTVVTCIYTELLPVVPTSFEPKDVLMDVGFVDPSDPNKITPHMLELAYNTIITYSKDQIIQNGETTVILKAGDYAMINRNLKTLMMQSTR